MTPDLALDRLAIIAGILPVYKDLSGHERPTLKETKLALLKAAGWVVDQDADIVQAVRQIEANRQQLLFPENLIVTAGRAKRLNTPQQVEWRLEPEDASVAAVEGKSNHYISLPPLASGVHYLTVNTGKHSESIRLIAAPPSVPVLTDVLGRERAWGVNTALYGLHSTVHPGIGNYNDLATLACGLAENGADFVGINPVHALGWNSAEVISPYSPSHRGYLNTTHLDCNRIEPVSEKTRGLMAQWRSDRNGNSSDLIDYQSHAQSHGVLLRSLFEDFLSQATPAQKSDFVSFCKSEGLPLVRFAQFETLTNQHGADWRTWSEKLQRPEDELEFDHPEIQFHQWLQWQAERQLQRAQEQALSSGMGLGLYLDLAVGARRGGAEAWGEQSSIAEGVSIGAPPDKLSPAGQNWDLAAFAPNKLAADDYRPFRTILQRNMRHCGVLRIDHVLGLNRSYWLPDDGTPGGYICHNFEVLLALIRIEAERSGTVIIGEDLGLVPNGLRAALAKSGVYSYSVLQYEKTKSGGFRHPSKLRKHSLACFGTHDTPTLKGFCEGRDIDWWQKLGWIDAQKRNDLHHERAEEVEELGRLKTQSSPYSELDPINHTVHASLAASPVALLSVQLDDIEGQNEAQNLPGTIDEHPNWRRRTKTPVEDIASHSGLKEMGKVMAENGRANQHQRG